MAITFNISNSGKRSATIEAAGEGITLVLRAAELVKTWESGVDVAKKLEAALNA